MIPERKSMLGLTRTASPSGERTAPYPALAGGSAIPFLSFFIYVTGMILGRVKLRQVCEMLTLTVGTQPSSMLATAVCRTGKPTDKTVESCQLESSGHVSPGSLPFEGHSYHTEEAILEDRTGDPSPLQCSSGSRLLPQLCAVPAAAPGQGHAL